MNADSVKAKIQVLIDRSNAKTGNADTDLTSAVGALVAGYGQGKNPVLTELEVTENGEYTPGEGVDGFSKVKVDVESSGGGGFFISPYGVGYTANMVLDCTDVGCTWQLADNLKSLALPEWNPTSASNINIKSNSGNDLFSSSSLENLLLPKAQYCGHYWVRNATGLKTVQLGSVGFPNLKGLGSLLFYGCTQSDLEITVYVDAITLADAKAVTGAPPWSATNATIIYRNSTTGEVITE